MLSKFIKTVPALLGLVLCTQSGMALCPAFQAKVIRESKLIETSNGQVTMVRRDTGEIMVNEDGNILLNIETDAASDLSQGVTKTSIYSDFSTKKRITLSHSLKQYQIASLSKPPCPGSFEHPQQSSGTHEGAIVYREGKVMGPNLKGEFVNAGYRRFLPQLKQILEESIDKEVKPGVINRHFYRIQDIRPLEKDKFVFSIPANYTENTKGACCGASNAAK